MAGGECWAGYINRLKLASRASYGSDGFGSSLTQANKVHKDRDNTRVMTDSARLSNFIQVSI